MTSVLEIFQPKLINLQTIIVDIIKEKFQIKNVDYQVGMTGLLVLQHVDRVGKRENEGH